MWSRKTLKTEAKGVLKKSYWKIFAACAAAFIITSAANPAADSFRKHFLNFDNSHVVNMFVRYVLIWVFILAFKFFVSNVIKVGLFRFLLDARQNKPSIGTLFWAFKDGRYSNTVKTMFSYNIRIFLWSLLFVAPGIIKTFQYFYVPFILADAPDSKNALDQSSEMTKGEKGKIFVLEMSFIGWLVLGALACGVGLLFVIPYIEITNAGLYSFAKDRIRANG